MKKLIAVIVFGAAALNGFTQGSIGFQNSIATPIYIGTSIATSYAASQKATQATLPDGGTIDVGLFWGTSAGSVTTLGALTQMSTTAGIFSGSIGTIIAGANPGDTDFFSVIAWDSIYGDTYAGEQACLAAGDWWGASLQSAYGDAPVLPFTLRPTVNPGENIFGPSSATGVFHLFALTTDSPEPTTLALGGLGATVLLLVRRRK